MQISFICIPLIFKEKVEEYARPFMCPTKIRDGLERFPLLHLPSVQFVKDKQSNIKTKININYDKSFPNMFKCVENLRNIANFSSGNVEPFAKVWSRLKNFVPQKESPNIAENKK